MDTKTKIKRILNGNDLQPRVCFHHEKSVFFGKYCPYCKVKTGTYGAFFVYNWNPFPVVYYLFGTSFYLFKIEIKKRIEGWVKKK